VVREAHGQLGLAEVPAKGRWMMKNLVRKAALLRVPLNPPPFLPFNPLLALRRWAGNFVLLR
jgi:hypothetical protein